MKNVFHKNRIALVHGNDGSDVRVGKICRSLSRSGQEVIFIGWDRRPRAQKQIDLGNAKSHLMILETPNGQPTLGGAARFAWHVARKLAKLRPRVVCCVNEDNILLALPWRRLFYRYLVGDIHDELMNRKSHLGQVAFQLLKTAGYVARTAADRLMVVDRTRFDGYGRFRKKCTIVQNYPEDPGDEPAKNHPQGPVKIYVAGSLHSRRGLRQIIEAVDACDNVQIVSAGWLVDDVARETFATHPKVTYHSIVTARESLLLAASCDAVLALYEPISINNLQASPNKIFDAMSVGRPVIINEETHISKWVVENNYGMRCPYYDVKALKDIIRSLQQNRHSLPERANYLREAFKKSFTWDSLEQKLLAVYNFENTGSADSVG